MAYADDPEGYMQQLEAKLQPQRIRATQSFAGLYQITHEMIKQSVLEEVRLSHAAALSRTVAYSQGFDETGWLDDEEQYKRRVLSGVPMIGLELSPRPPAGPPEPFQTQGPGNDRRSVGANG